MASDANYLAKVLMELGPASCDQHVFTDVLQQLGPVIGKGGVESQVANALTMMCCSGSASKGGSSLVNTSSGVSFGTARTEAAHSIGTWNTSLFGLAVAEAFPKVDVNRTLAFLDTPAFIVGDSRVAEMVISFFKGLCGKSFYQSIQLKVLATPWAHIRGQLSLIFYLLLLPPEVVNMSLFTNVRRVLSHEDCASLSPAGRTIASNLISQTWNCMDLFEFTANVIDTDAFEDAKPIFELASRQCPELLCIALAIMDPSWNSINKEILVKLVCGFLIGQPSSSVVLPRIWAHNPNVLLFCMVEMHRRDSTCLSRLLDVAQELRVLPVILDAKPFSFTLDLACLASRRQNLNIEKFLSDSLREKGEPFLRSAIEFLADKVATQITRSRPVANPHSVPIAIETLHLFVRLLTPYFGAMPADIAEVFRDVIRVFTPSDAAQGNSADHVNSVAGPETGGESPSAMPDMTFAADIEEEVNLFFDRIFAREVSVDDVVGVLRRLKTSTSARDQQVFACFLHNIFDEFRFFSKYPDNELGLTAVLFGSLVQHHLVEYMPLGLALKCVLEALKKASGTKLFRFGIIALTYFAPRLPEWPQFCTHVAAISAIQQTHTELYAYVHSCAAGSPTHPPPTSSVDSLIAGGSLAQASAVSHAPPTSTPATSAPAASETTNPLLEAADSSDIRPPSDAVRDRILFIFNNVSTGNMAQKALDMRRVLEAPLHAWFAQYLVVRRASLEPNNHSLYLDFLHALDLEPLIGQVLKQTYSSISVLLCSSKIANSSSERTLLKNLGAFLGSLTLARNRPILYKDLRLKELLIDAFYSDKLIFVLPFVCKVIEQSARSRAFIPENPWLMTILKLLAELYVYADLRLNLKFEIEVLCKNISVDLHAIEASDLLKQQPNSMPDSSLHIRAPGTANGQHLAHGGLAGFPGSDSALHSLVSLATYRVGNTRYMSIMRALLAVAVEYAVRDIALTVAQRCFAISSGTTRAIVGKDHSAHVSGTGVAAMRKAAMAMAPALASSLAAATARESLRTAIVSNLRAFCQWAGVPHVLTDAAAESLADENMDLACAYVERLTYERTLSHIDSVLPPDFDPSPYAPPGGSLPMPDGILAALYTEFVQRFRPAHLSSLPAIPFDPVAQDELERFASLLAALQSSTTALPHAPATVDTVGRMVEHAPMSPGVPAVDSASGLPGDSTFEASVSKASEILHSLQQMAADVSTSDPSINAVASLPATHDVRALMKQFVLLASANPIYRDDLCLAMAQKVLQSLLRTESALLIDTFVLLLIKIFEFSSRAAKEVTAWVVQSADERKYNVPATTALFASGLIYVLDYDGQLARQIEVVLSSGESGSKVIQFAVALVRNCVLRSNPPIAAPYDFVFTLEALGKTASPGGDIAALLQDIAAVVRSPQPEAQALRDRVAFCFTDWFRLCQYPSISDKLVESFVTQLFARRFLSEEEAARSFFQICTELAIELYVRQRRSPSILAYRSIDAFARLVGQVLRHVYKRGEAANNEPLVAVDPMKIVSIVHSVGGMILLQGIEQGLDYLQKPFTRLFAALAGEMVRAVMIARPDDIGALVDNLVAFYDILRPSNQPSFAFGWLELISARWLLPYLLVPDKVTHAAGSIVAQRHMLLLSMLTDFLTFAHPMLALYDSNDATRALYRGVLRLFLIILHDCPSFFVTYSKRILLCLPYTVVQLRNTVLSAVPSDVSIPDPLSATVRTIFNRDDSSGALKDEYAAVLSSALRSACTNCLQSLGSVRLPTPVTASGLTVSILSQLATSLASDCTGQPSTELLSQVSPSFASQIHMLVSYLGASEMSLLSSGTELRAALRSSSVVVDLIRSAFASSFDDPHLAGLSKGHLSLLRYLLVCSVADNLTYPCTTTNYFYAVVMALFEDLPAQQSPSRAREHLVLRECITRVLLERLIVHRPHPWGVMVSFIEIVKNPQFGFWDLPFTRATPDVERVFEAISRSCLGTAAPVSAGSSVMAPATR